MKRFVRAGSVDRSFLRRFQEYLKGGSAAQPLGLDPRWTPIWKNWCRRTELNCGPTDYGSADRADQPYADTDGIFARQQVA